MQEKSNTPLGSPPTKKHSAQDINHFDDINIIKPIKIEELKVETRVLDFSPALFDKHDTFKFQLEKMEPGGGPSPADL
jgi:hypothetical protein